MLCGGASASPALVVAATADDDALRAAMVEVGFSALTKGETSSVLQAAAGSGVVCVEVDVACWQAVATLSGYDDVVLATPTEVITSNRVGVRRSPRLTAGPDGVRGALLRALGRAGAVVITLSPATGKVTVDGATVAAGVADGLTPGTVAVIASADGFGSRGEDVVVTAGATTALTWTLEPASATVQAADNSLSTTLLYGGLATVGVGVIAGTAIAAVNFSANCAFVPASPEFPNGLSCKDTSGGSGRPNHADAQLVDVVAIVIGGGLAVVGASAAVASLFVE